jgi:hypothetical protein
VDISVALTAGCFAIPGGAENTGVVFPVSAGKTPVNTFRALAKAIDSSSRFTCSKTLEFGSRRLIATGLNGRVDCPGQLSLNRPRSIRCNHLHLSDSAVASVITEVAIAPDMSRSCMNTPKRNPLNTSAPLATQRYRCV